MTAHQAIARSIAYDETVTIPFDTDVYMDLLVECEDLAARDGGVDIWGQTEDGGSWRVYMVLPIAEVA